jgi:hypothetical protein
MTFQCIQRAHETFDYVIADGTDEIMGKVFPTSSGYSAEWFNNDETWGRMQMTSLNDAQTVVEGRLQAKTSVTIRILRSIEAE